MTLRRKHIFMTGATGYFGSRILKLLLEQQWECTLLIRGKSYQTPTAQLESVLSDLGMDSTMIPWSRIHIITADLRSPSLHDYFRGGESFDCFLHAAAIVKTAVAAEDIYATNVLGTASALKLAEHIRAKHFIYVSTAYTCGQGSVNEVETTYVTEEIQFATCNNLYEESKRQAEQLVKDSQVPWTILRPSILTHSAQPDRTGVSQSNTNAIGLVGWFKLVERCAAIAAEKNLLPLNIPACDASVLDFIDVNAAARITQLLCDKAATNEVNQILLQEFLITSRNQLTAGDIIQTACNLLGTQIVARGRTHEPSNAIERMYMKYGDFFVAYSNQFLQFDRSRLEALLKDPKLTLALDLVDLMGCGKSALSATDGDMPLIDTSTNNYSLNLQAM